MTTRRPLREQRQGLVNSAELPRDTGSASVGEGPLPATVQRLWSTLGSLLAGALLLTGCGSVVDMTYFRPSGDGKVTSFKGSASCFFVPDAIDLAYGQGVRVTLQAYAWTTEELAAAKSSAGPQTRVSGKLRVPVGLNVKFVGPIHIRAVSGRDGEGAVTTASRGISWSPKPNGGGGVRFETQSLSPTSTLSGWSAADAQAAGLAPAGSYVFPDTLTVIDFGGHVADFAEPSFTIESPALEINGRLSPGKSVVFTRTESRVRGVACP